MLKNTSSSIQLSFALLFSYRCIFYINSVNLAQFKGIVHALIVFLHRGSLIESIGEHCVILLIPGAKEGWDDITILQNALDVGLNPKSADSLRSVWSKHSNGIRSSLLRQIMAVNNLVNLDWSFGVTTATDENEEVRIRGHIYFRHRCVHRYIYSQLNRTFLQMKLTIRAEDGSLQDSFVELTVEQFYAFIAQMERARALMDAIQT